MQPARRAMSMRECNITLRTAVTKFTHLPVCEFVLTITESGNTSTMNNNANATGTDGLIQNILTKLSRGEVLTHAELQLLIQHHNAAYGQQTTFQQNPLMNQIEHALAMNATTGVLRNQMHLFRSPAGIGAAGLASGPTTGNSVSPTNVYPVDSEDSNES
jgi:hypothetical protein